MTTDTPLLKQVVRDSAIYGAATLLARGVSVALIPLYTRVLSPAEFGVSDVLLTLVTLVDIVISLEIAQGLMRFFPDEQAEAKKEAMVSSSFWFVAGGHLLFIITLAPFSSRLSTLLLGSSDYSTPFLITLVILMFYGLYNLTSIVLRVRLQAFHFSVSSFAFAAVSGLTTILFVLALDMGVTGLLLGNLLGYISATGLCLYFARGNYMWRFDPASLQGLLRFSAPLIPSSLGYFMTFYINRIALNFLLTLNDVGLYSIAYRLASPVNMIMNSISASLTPLIYSTYRAERTPFELARIFRLLTAASLLLILTLSIFADEILRLMTTPNYYPAAKIIPFLALSAALSGFYIFTPGLFIANDTWLISGINMASGLLNVGLNFLLIPSLGLYGAALGTCIALLVNLAVSMFFSQRRYFIPIQWDRIFWGACIFAALVLVGYSLGAASVPVELAKFGLLAAAGLLFLLVRLVEFTEVTRFLGYLRAKAGSLLQRSK